MRKLIPIFVFAVVLNLASCTSITVTPPDASLSMKHVCIEINPKVEVSDFVSVVQDGFQRHGISSSVYSPPKPADCEYILTYTARRSWDIVPYLSVAEIKIEKDGRQVAFAEYHLVGKGGFSLMKYQGTKAKMDPVIDELLKNQPL
jgi:hypothetical protein